MKTREYNIGDKKIEIYDDEFTALEKIKLYRQAYHQNFTIDRENLDIPESEVLPKSLKSNYELDDILKSEFFKNKTILNLIEQHNQRVWRVYVNLGTASDVYAYHTDGGCPNSKTIVYYLNTEWGTTWEGETHFSDDTMQDILVSSSFKPGRFVLFDAILPHKSSQPSFDAKFFRFVFTVKMVGKGDPNWNNSLKIQDFIYEQYPENSLSEKEKQIVVYLKENLEEVKFKNSYNTFSILKKLNQPEDVCVAGLLRGNMNKSLSEMVDKEVIDSLLLPLRNFKPLQDNTEEDVNFIKKLHIVYAIAIAKIGHEKTDKSFLIALRNKIDTLQ